MSTPTAEDAAVTDEELIEIDRGYVDMERQAYLEAHGNGSATPRLATARHGSEKERQMSLKDRDGQAGRVVDVVLSDMSAPWDQTTGFWQRSVTEPYHRMQNTSGIAFKDHAGSMVRLLLLHHLCWCCRSLYRKKN
jgi:21S rRNA (uridine2791-2'-O)-methyltransferase